LATSWDAVVLVRVVTPIHRHASGADDGKKHLAAVQALRAADRLSDAKASRHPSWRRDVEQVRALLGHQRIDTTQIYTMIRPAQLKQAVSFYEEPARRMLENVGSVRESMFEEHLNVPQTRSEFP
jgi:hypothetical protein